MIKAETDNFKQSEIDRTFAIGFLRGWKDRDCAVAAREFALDAISFDECISHIRYVVLSIKTIYTDMSDEERNILDERLSELIKAPPPSLDRDKTYRNGVILGVFMGICAKDIDTITLLCWSRLSLDKEVESILLSDTTPS